MRFSELKSKFLQFEMFSYCDYEDENLILLWETSNFTRSLLIKNYYLVNQYFVKDEDNSKRFLVVGDHTIDKTLMIVETLKMLN